MALGEWIWKKEKKKDEEKKNLTFKAVYTVLVKTVFHIL